MYAVNDGYNEFSTMNAANAARVAHAWARQGRAPKLWAIGRAGGMVVCRVVNLATSTAATAARAVAAVRAIKAAA